MERIILFLFVLSVLSPNSWSYSLEKLERIVAPFRTIRAFRANSQAVEEYREALKHYQNDIGEDFDKVFEQFNWQLGVLIDHVPGFAEAAWKLDPEWATKRFSILGEAEGSGLIMKRTAMAEALKNLNAELAQDVADLEKMGGAYRVSRELSAQFGLVNAATANTFSTARMTKYRRRLAGDGDESKSLANHPAYKALSGYLLSAARASTALAPSWLGSDDPDIFMRGIRELSDFSKQKNLAVPDYLMPYFRYAGKTFLEIEKAYKEGLESMGQFRNIPEAAMTPALLQAYHSLLAAGRWNPDNPPLNDVGLIREWREWRDELARIRKKKREHAHKYFVENPYFFYTLFDDKFSHTLQLKDAGGMELHFVPSPRPFHAFLAGRKNRECVGGNSSKDLSARRWARAAYEGATFLFTETGTGRMEGFVSTNVIENNRAQKYAALDLGSNKIKGSVILRRDEGRLVKTTFFDEFVNQWRPESRDIRGLVVSNSEQVNRNVRGSMVVLHSLAYRENWWLGSAKDFSPVGSMAYKVEKITEPAAGYSSGMIFEAMPGENSARVALSVLVPKHARYKWTERALDEEIALRMLGGDEISDADDIWARAFESGVKLKPMEEYRDRFSRPNLNRDFIRRLGIRIEGKLGEEWDSPWVAARALRWLLEDPKNVEILTLPMLNRLEEKRYNSSHNPDQLFLEVLTRIVNLKPSWILKMKMRSAYKLGIPKDNLGFWMNVSRTDWLKAGLRRPLKTCVQLLLLGHDRIFFDKRSANN